MGKHTQNCTLIGKGVYGTIGVDQRSRLADGAHFHTMIVTSTLEASVIEGDKLVVVPEFLRTLVFARPRGDDQFADCTFSPSLDMSR